MTTYCKVCGGPVLMMVRRGSDICSLDCEKKIGAGKYADRQPVDEMETIAPEGDS
jgi:hypothetical protein